MKDQFQFYTQDVILNIGNLILLDAIYSKSINPFLIREELHDFL